MTMQIQVIFLLILSKQAMTEIANMLVSHYDCRQPIEPEIYSLTDMPDCDLQLEEMKLNYGHAILYQINYLTQFKAFRCELSYQRHIYCVDWSSDSLDKKDLPNLRREIPMLGTECDLAFKEGSASFSIEGDTFNIDFSLNSKKTYMVTKYVTQEQSLERVQQDENSKCKGKQEVRVFSFESQIIETTIRYNPKDYSIYNDEGHILHCQPQSGKCDSTVTQQKSYVWEPKDTCILLQVRNNYYMKMIKWRNRYFVTNQEGLKPASKFDVEIFREAHYYCGQNKKLMWKTNYENIIMWFEGGFEPMTGEIVQNELNKINTAWDGYHQPRQVDTMFIVNNSRFLKSDYRELLKPIHEYKDREREWKVGIDNNVIDYDLHANARTEFFFHRSMVYLRDSDIEQLSKICEVNRKIFLTSLLAANKNSKLAGYILTGKREAFFETTGSVGYLYKCKLMFSPLKVIKNRCFNRIPIDTGGLTLFVDPLTRQTFDFAEEIYCKPSIKNIFQLDEKDENSWYLLSPQPIHFTAPKQFRADTRKETKPTAKSNDIGMYLFPQMQKFWNAIAVTKKQDKLLNGFILSLLDEIAINTEKMIQTKDNEERQKQRPLKREYLYIDNFISSTFFTERYIEHFGLPSYWITKCGIVYICCTAINGLISFCFSIYRTIELRRLLKPHQNFMIAFASTLHIFYLTQLYELLSSKKKEKGYINCKKGKNDFNKLTKLQIEEIEKIKEMFKQENEAIYEEMA
jgi:hypothetical protein